MYNPTILSTVPLRLIGPATPDRNSEARPPLRPLWDVMAAQHVQRLAQTCTRVGLLLHCALACQRHGAIANIRVYARGCQYVRATADR
jgi:hypothetical protein